MSCPFDFGHYRELLDAARAGGYRFAFFEGEPREGDLLLRHDVDISLDAALRLAELEAEAGARATYFLMTESVFYNLASAEGERALPRLRELGHSVGLHAVYPRAGSDERFRDDCPRAVGGQGRARVCGRRLGGGRRCRHVAQGGSRWPL